VLVAPATAHLIARLAHGLADDLLTTLVLATRAGLAGAGDEPADVAASGDGGRTCACSAARLPHARARTVGAQACGETGPGRMLEPVDIADALLSPGAVETVGRWRVFVCS
jgi:phosphopantothenoylcysteine decarboxylase/phosphopantothenate--cysteine ligase